MDGKIGLITAAAAVVVIVVVAVYAGCPLCSRSTADGGEKIGEKVSAQEGKPACAACKSDAACAVRPAAKTNTEIKAKPQTTCPVMGGKIDKGTYVDVEGKRIYACCPGCLPKIKADPKKYIEKIRQKGEEPEISWIGLVVTPG